jgi:formamidopyrimidine-DNA glycosylase
MPELPEVETTKRGIAPHILQQTVHSVIIRQYQLRWPITAELLTELPGQILRSVDRRGKYLILASSKTEASEMDTGKSYLLIHLGMSGSLRLVAADSPIGKHDHVDITMTSGMTLRYTDPRRFGCMLWYSSGDPLAHPLLRSLGPEPLSDAFTPDYLRLQALGRKVPVKSFIMDSKVVVGVGNIYANEALFMAGIDPRRAAGRISAQRYALLTERIKEVLARAIVMGGTTLRDFTGATGQPGYFKQSLAVYGRGGEPCVRCGTKLREIRITQRSTVFCPVCQI